MAKLGAWVTKHLVFRPRRQEQATGEGQPPFLSLPRRPITPTSFDTTTCLFLQLPYDIRSIILFMAFGGRTFHVDLEHQEENWQWRGNVCMRSSWSSAMWYGWLGPWFHANSREMQKQDCYKAHDIGVMGFLLSCRQAYTEGINVLYSANCISIRTERLLLDFPKLMLHSRLESITSLEIVVEAHEVEQENGRTSFKLDHLEPILDSIVTHCRHLRRLCLSFIVW
jgi:hypothetical protein